MGTAKVTRYNLFPAQFEFLFGYPESIHDQDEVYIDVACYRGGVGSGKTFCGSLRGLIFAFQWAGCHGLVGALSEDLLNTTTKQKYIEHLENMGMKEGVHWWFEDRKSVIRLKNGSSIKFKTMSDWRQFMSTEYTWIEMEEASFIDEITFKKLLTRLREFKKTNWKKYYRSMFLHTNPQGKRGWINRLFCNPKTKIKNYRLVTASTRENEYLGKSYIEALEDLYDADEVAEMLDGQDVDNDNTVAFPHFTNDNVVENLKYDDKSALILSCDFNYNPMCWYLMQQVVDEQGIKKWHILRELIANNITTKQMCEEVLPIIQQFNHKDSLIIMGDSHGRDRKTNGSDYSVMLKFFKEKGFSCILKVQKANPLIKERLSTLRGHIRNAKGLRRLFVDSSCIRLIYNFEEAKNDLSRASLKAPTDNEIQQNYDLLYMIHPIDAISYPIHFNQTFEENISKT